MKTIATIALLAAGFPWAASAADIYRWVDDKGRTHLADTVPERYKAKAERIDSEQFKLSEADRQRAQARAAQRRAEREENLATRERTATPASAPASPSVTSASGSNDTDNCAALLQRYRESQECFAPYRMANGALRREAYERCENMQDPTPKCGPPNWE